MYIAVSGTDRVELVVDGDLGSVAVLAHDLLHLVETRVVRNALEVRDLVLVAQAVCNNNTVTRSGHTFQHRGAVAWNTPYQG